VLLNELIAQRKQVDRLLDQQSLLLNLIVPPNQQTSSQQGERLIVSRAYLKEYWHTHKYTLAQQGHKVKQDAIEDAF
jgi:hypothetical protein